jgi:hypothetical protein
MMVEPLPGSKAVELQRPPLQPEALPLKVWEAPN